MKRIILALVLSVTALTEAAGVTIVDNDVTHVASGQFNSPATPSTLNAYLYCELYGASLYCGAADGASAYASCSTSDPNYKRLFPMIRKTTTLQFFWDASGTCQRIDVFNGTLNPNNTPVVPGAMKSRAPTYVNTGIRYAYGTVAATPETGATESIGCVAQSSGQINCNARDSGGLFASCSVARDSVNQTLADQTLAVMGINESSLVYFSWDVVGKSNVCNFIYTVNASYQLP